MKFSKPLKSTVLSVALLFVGGAQAQSRNAPTALDIVAARGINFLSARSIAIGVYLQHDAASTIDVVCNGASTTTTINPPTLLVKGGRCAPVQMATTGNTALNVRLSITTTDLTGPGTAIPATAKLYNNNGASLIDLNTNQNVPGTGFVEYRMGVTVNLGVNQAVGIYSGTYTIMATVQ